MFGPSLKSEGQLYGMVSNLYSDTYKRIKVSPSKLDMNKGGYLEGLNLPLQSWQDYQHEWRECFGTLFKAIGDNATTDQALYNYLAPKLSRIAQRKESGITVFVEGTSPLRILSPSLFNLPSVILNPFHPEGQRIDLGDFVSFKGDPALHAPILSDLLLHLNSRDNKNDKGAALISESELDYRLDVKEGLALRMTSPTQVYLHASNILTKVIEKIIESPGGPVIEQELITFLSSDEHLRTIKTGNGLAYKTGMAGVALDIIREKTLPMLQVLANKWSKKKTVSLTDLTQDGSSSILGSSNERSPEGSAVNFVSNLAFKAISRANLYTTSYRRENPFIVVVPRGEDLVSLHTMRENNSSFARKGFFFCIGYSSLENMKSTENEAESILSEYRWGQSILSLYDSRVIQNDSSGKLPLIDQEKEFAQQWLKGGSPLRRRSVHVLSGITISEISDFRMGRISYLAEVEDFSSGSQKS